MDRIEYDHTKLTGNDADIETSLKEYGIAWIETDTEYLFYYGIKYGSLNDEYCDDMEGYVKFDFCSFDKDMDIKKEFDWVNWDDINSYADNFNTHSFPQQIDLLVSYYGFENIFGSTYWEGLNYNDIVKD